MKTKLKIRSEIIQRWLRDYYNVEAVETTFVPRGECSWNFFVTADDGDRYVLKIMRRGLCGTPLMTEAAVKAIMALYYDFGIKQMTPPPLRARTGQHINPIGTRGTHLGMLLQYVEGQAADDIGLDEKRERRLGALLATIHGCKLQQHERPPMEDFSGQIPQGLARILHEVDYPMGFYTPLQSTMLRMLRDARSQIELLVQEFQQMREELCRDESLPEQYVMCHGDPSPGNVIITESDNIFLIDWDTAMYAPRERDLMHIMDYPDALASYRSASNDYEPDERLLAFYRSQWNLAEIVDYGTRVLFFHQSEVQNEHDLSELTRHLKGIQLA